MADLSASSSTLGTVAAGGSYQDQIETAADYDWVKITGLVAGGVYTVLVQGLGTGDRTLADPLIEAIYNGSSAYMGGYNNDGLIGGSNGRDAMTTFTATGTTHYVSITGDQYTTGTYKVSVFNSSPSTDNVGQTTATTGAITVGAAATTVTIDSSTDIDWYKVTLVAGGIYSITLRGISSGNGTLADPLLSGIYDAGGNFIANTYIDDLDTRDAGMTFTALYNGDYFISADAYGNYTGTAKLQITQVGTDVPGSTASTATLAVPGSTPVTVDLPYDHDWYKVQLTANDTYTFTLTGTGTNNTPAIFGIYTAAGTYLEGYAPPVNNGTSTSATTSFTPAADGYYFIDTFSYYEGSYTLTAAVAATDLPAGTGTTGAITVDGAAVSGDIGGALDVDWFYVDLVLGNVYTVAMRGTSAANPSLTLADPLISGIYDASGNVLANTYSDDSDGRDAVVTLRPSASGRYYIAAEGYGANIGTYTVSVAKFAVADVGQTVATAGTISLNAAKTGLRIDDTADIDWYGADFTLGRTYYVTMQASGSPALADSIIAGIYDNTGTLLPNTTNDDISASSFNSAVLYTARSGGKYYIAAEGYQANTGIYTLTVADDAGQTAANAWLIPDNAAATGTIDSANELDWYGYTLQANKSYVFKMYGSGTNDGTLASPVINKLYNPSSTDVTASATRNTTNTSARYVPAADGTHYLEMTSAGTGTFRVTASVEAGNTNALALPGANAITGEIDDASDADWYSISLVANTSYVFKMRGSPSNNGTLSDPALALRNGTADVQAVVNDTTGYNTESEFRYVPTASGTYYMVADPVAAVTGTYLLNWEIEAGQTTASALATDVGSAFAAETDDVNDADWYAVALNTNTSYVVKMLGSTNNNGTLADPAVGLWDGAAWTKAMVDDTNGYGKDAEFRIVPTAAKTYYVVADPVAANNMGTYRLSIEVEAGDTNATAAAMTVGRAITATIDDDTDADWYSVALSPNTSYVIKMLGIDNGGGTLSNPSLGLRDGSAYVQAILDDTAGYGRDTAFLYSVGATGGTYYVTADPASTAIGSYRLSVEVEAGSTNATASTVAVGATTYAAIDTGADVDRYAVTLVAGRTYRIDAKAADSNNGTLIDPFINGIRDVNGTLLAGTAQDGGGSGRDASLSFTAAGNGVFYIDIDNGTANSTAVGSYVFSVTQTSPPQAFAMLSMIGVPEGGETSLFG